MDQVVALMRKHVQCEIDLRQNSCMLLRERGIIPPLVFRPWYDIETQPWMITLRNRTGHEALNQFEVGGIAGVVQHVDEPRVLIEQAEIAEVYL